jgi:hypothetical protein
MKRAGAEHRLVASTATDVDRMNEIYILISIYCEICNI